MQNWNKNAVGTGLFPDKRKTYMALPTESVLFSRYRVRDLRGFRGSYVTGGKSNSGIKKILATFRAGECSGDAFLDLYLGGTRFECRRR
jgi:hypothetical protein